MAWAVYYDDGSRVTDRDTAVDAVPARGVLAIGQADDRVGRHILTRMDFYWWTADDGWYGGDIFGLWDYLTMPGMKRVLFGRSVPDATYERAIERARTDDYLPPKSARRPAENH